MAKIRLALPGPGATQLWVAKEKVCQFDELGFDEGLKEEVESWLVKNFGPEAEDWSTSECWTYEDFGMTSICFHFKDANHAVLFKLTWC